MFLPFVMTISRRTSLTLPLSTRMPGYLPRNGNHIHGLRIGMNHPSPDGLKLGAGFTLFHQKTKKPALMGRLTDRYRSQQPFRQPLYPMEADRWLCVARLPGIRLFDGVNGLTYVFGFCVNYHACRALSIVFSNCIYSSQCI